MTLFLGGCRKHLFPLPPFPFFFPLDGRKVLILIKVKFFFPLTFEEKFPVQERELCFFSPFPLGRWIFLLTASKENIVTPLSFLFPPPPGRNIILYFVFAFHTSLLQTDFSPPPFLAPSKRGQNFPLPPESLCLFFFSPLPLFFFFSPTLLFFHISFSKITNVIQGHVLFSVEIADNNFCFPDSTL